MGILSVFEVTLGFLVLRLAERISGLTRGTDCELMNTFTLRFTIESCVLFWPVLWEPLDCVEAAIIIRNFIILKLLTVWDMGIVLEMLMPIEVGIVSCILDHWQKVSDDVLIVIIMEAEHWMVHRCCLPNDILICLLFLESITDPPHHLIALVNECLITLAS